MKKALIWFRKDLRLNDNELLKTAAQEGLEVVPVYIEDEDQEYSSFRKAFLFESISELDKNIRLAGGSGLICLRGTPSEIIPQLCGKYRVDKVLFAKEPGWNEKTIEDSLVAALNKLGIGWSVSFHNFLFSPERLPFTLDQLPDIFTSFRKKTEHLLPAKSRETENALPVFGKNLENLFEEPTGIAQKSNFSGGESSGLSRMAYYIHESGYIQNYKETRNGLLGADFSSQLSPWLALGCISPLRIVYEVRKFEEQVVSNESTYWLIFELLWREYFRWVMIRFPRNLFLKQGIRGLPRKYSADKRKFRAWVEGTTGQPFIDAAMIELKETGFMSNRARQNAASYLVHDLEQNWLKGAAYFEKMLVDYDVSSNYGNWAYIAGVGNDPRPVRRFNPEKQSEMYDPEGKYVKHWLK
jgi:deoxyribodipyrimidine photo-lyase